MKCYDPTLCYIDRETGKRIFRSFSVASKSTYFNDDHIVFNCNKCLFCRKKRAYELACRCVLHSSIYKKNCFLTLTYDESKEDYHNEFQYKDVQDFKKRLRKHVWTKHKKQIEVFNVHEYGKNGKKHWHLIVFNHDFDDKTVHTYNQGRALWVSRTLEKLWRHGFSTIGEVSEASAMYQAQYMEKDTRNGHSGTKKKSHSKHSGIGKPFFLQNYKQILMLGFIPFSGKKMPLPRYFEKLAHKHWSHYYEPINFFDTPTRKRLYSMFDPNKEEPNKEIADLFIYYQSVKKQKIEQLTKEWEQVISDFIDTHEKTQFQKSGENALYDLKNKHKQEIF